MRENLQPVAGVVLAAGRGERLGQGPKAFVTLDGERLVDRACRVLAEAGIHEGAIVLPPRAETPAPLDLPPAFQVLHNEHPEEGPLSSAILGLSAIDADRVCLYPVDFAAVRPETVRALCTEFGDPVGALARAVARIIPRFESSLGHPILLLPPGVRAVRSVSHPERTTLRDVLAAAGPIRVVDVADAGVCWNLNRPEDLATRPASP